VIVECLTGDTKKNSLVLFIAPEQDVVAGIALATAVKGDDAFSVGSVMSISANE
jgi:hypothetical protein